MKTIPIKNNSIQDNVFYVVESGKNSFDIVVNGTDIYDFMSYYGWSTPALTNIRSRQNANHLADFLNKLWQFAQQTKQKEIQKVLGIQSKEDIESIITESFNNFEDKIINIFDNRVKNTSIIDNVIDEKLSEHTRDYQHHRDSRDY